MSGPRRLGTIVAAAWALCSTSSLSVAAEAGVRVEELEDYQGQPAWRITTPAATYVYHKKGGGFASVLDRDGKDWLSYRPTGGSDGKFRGIPNVINPENGFHPGGEICESTLVEEGPAKAVIESHTADGAWSCRWTILPTHAVMDLEKQGHVHWFLYEGTPGGAYDETKAYMVDSAGRREPCTARWERRLPDPRWIYFGTEGSPRVLFLADLAARPQEVVDSFWSMQKNMTVFGFGRSLANGPRWRLLKEEPARFAIGLVESTDHAEVSRRIGEMTK